jgi:beta-exotoxin I transport system permease protein
MTRFVLVRKTLRDVRIATIAVGAAVFLMAFFITAAYPQYQQQLQGFQVPGYMKGFLGETGDLTSPAGFFQAEFFSWVPLLLITVAIIGATGTLAGEEGTGTLEALLALPVTRVRLLLAKCAGLVLALVITAVVMVPGFMLGLLFVDIDLGVGRMLLAALNMVPLALLFLTLSLWAAAALPSRGAAAAVSIGAVVVTYFLNMLGASIATLETPRKLSPFYWSDASRILLHGSLDWERLAGMLACAALFLLLALWSFQRRDISGGASEWRLLPRWLRRPAEQRPLPQRPQPVP